MLFTLLMSIILLKLIVIKSVSCIMSVSSPSAELKTLPSFIVTVIESFGSPQYFSVPVKSASLTLTETGERLTLFHKALPPYMPTRFETSKLFAELE